MVDSNAVLFERAQRVIPGGVNSPVRSFRAVGGIPRFIARGEGAYIWDAEGKRYLDMVGSWGAAIAGHANPLVVDAVKQAVSQGLSFGAPTEAEVEMAELLTSLLPSLEMVRLVSSGTEATMSAIRLARGFTGRDLLIKFEGCYHGHSDGLLVAAGSGALTFGHPTSAGVSSQIASQTMVLPFNDLGALEKAFKQHGDKVAAVIVEPIAGNMNLIIPAEGYLAGMRALCDRYGVVLIFDEVMTGFRVGPRGVQGRVNIVPDLTTLGKVIGGGMPVAAFGGRRDIMACLAPLGKVYQAGTLSGNPVAVAAGLATLKIIQGASFYAHLTAVTSRWVDGINKIAKTSVNPVCAQSAGGMFGLYCSQVVPNNYAEMMAMNMDLFKVIFHGLLDRGIYLPPAAYEAGFISAAHTDKDIDFALESIQAVLNC